MNKIRIAVKKKNLAGDSFPEAAARSLYKLMAYKDEYEVARAYTDNSYQQKLDAQFDGDYKVKFHFSPPLFAARDAVTGQPLKREYGSWMWWALKILAPLKIVRGSLFDPFGYVAERRKERQLISDYQSMLDEIIINLTSDNYQLAVELASLPMQIRGFGRVKDLAIKEFEIEQQQMLDKFRS